MSGQNRRISAGKHDHEEWDGARLLALRRRLELTQRQFAEELGVRQQTVSEWETGVYRPRGASARLLGIVAERAEFVYGTASSQEIDTDDQTAVKAHGEESQ